MSDGPRILGVDDSLTIRKALELVLKPAGYELELAADGAEAIAKAKAFRPELILLDFILPDMRGTEVCQQLAADAETANIPVVLISAKGAEIRQAYRDAGNVVSYIAKPFKPQVITSIVGEVLAKHAAGELIKSMVPVHEGLGTATAPPPTVEAGAVLPPVTFTAEVVQPSTQPSNGDAHGYAAAARVLPTANDEAEDSEIETEETFDQSVDTRWSEATRRDMLELMFETLRAGLEGVYVEEVDTPTGAAADQAKSYTEMIEPLGRELEEALRHARSGARHALYGDGSVRALDDTLPDIFRRSCRLLFRAVVAGAVENETPTNRPRILVACHKGSAVHEQLRALLAAHADWQVFTISEGFRQLPIMTRLYGPTHVLVEVTGSGALWDQLRLVHRMPEAKAMSVFGLVDATRAGHATLSEPAQQAALAERGVLNVVQSAFDLELLLCGSSPHDASVSSPSAPVFSAEDPGTMAFANA